MSLAGSSAHVIPASIDTAGHPNIARSLAGMHRQSKNCASRPRDRQKFRPAQINDMALVLVGGVVDFGDDETCCLALEFNGFSPGDARRYLDRARERARNARVAEADFWGLQQWP